MKGKDFEDDGRTVADMSDTQMNSVFGVRQMFGRAKRKPGDVEQIPMTAKEKRSMMFSAILAGLTVSAVFIAAFYLFILFCIHIWFK